MRTATDSQTWVVWVEVLIGLAVAVAVLSRSAEGAAASVVFLVGAASAAFTAFVSYRAFTALTDDRLPAAAGGEDRRAALEHEKKLALAALKELDADAAMGKVDARDLPTLKATAEARALALIKEIRAQDEHWRKKAEQAVGAGPAEAALAPPGPGPGAPAAAGSAPGRPAPALFDHRPAAWAGVRCTGCGFAANPVDGRFCVHCGRPRAVP